MGFFDDEKSNDAKSSERSFGEGREAGRSGEEGSFLLGLREVIGTAVPSTKEYDSYVAGVREGITDRASSNSSSTHSSYDNYGGMSESASGSSSYPLPTTQGIRKGSSRPVAITIGVIAGYLFANVLSGFVENVVTESGIRQTQDFVNFFTIWITSSSILFGTMVASILRRNAATGWWSTILLILGLAVGRVFLNAAASSTQSGEVPQITSVSHVADPPRPDAIDPHVDYANSESLFVNTDKGKIRINNFFLGATKKQDDAGVLHEAIPVDFTIVSTSKYTIDYDSLMLWSNPNPQNGCFDIDFPLGVAYGSPEQKSAEQNLMAILGVSESDFCKLPISEGFGDAGVQRLHPSICP